MIGLITEIANICKRRRMDVIIIIIIIFVY